MISYDTDIVIESYITLCFSYIMDDTQKQKKIDVVWYKWFALKARKWTDIYLNQLKKNGFVKLCVGYSLCVSLILPAETKSSRSE